MRSRWQTDSNRAWWSQHREASLNWLALGMLLAAWNAADNAPAPQTRRRPEELRGYAFISVRAANIHSAELRREHRAHAGIHESVNIL